MCVNRDAASAFFYSPFIWGTQEWVCVCQIIQYTSLKSWPTAVEELTIPRLDYPSALVMYIFS